MKLLENKDSTDEDKDVVFDKVNEFPYNGAMLSTKNIWSRELRIRIAKAESVLFDLCQIKKSK